MGADRTLLWLSPDPEQSLPSLTLADRWHLVPIDLNQPPNVRSVPPVPRVGVLDLQNYDSERLPWLEEWLVALSPTTWVGLTSQSPYDEPSLGTLIGTYCADYHTLPLDLPRLDTVLGHLWGMADLQARLAEGHKASLQRHALAGDSPRIHQTRTLLQRFAQTLEPVLIHGASGTGKEAAARFLHDHSPVSHGPFATINCAALPSSLSDDALLEHEPGTGVGSVDSAHGGSLLLQAVDELTLEQQPALLGLFQDEPGAAGHQRDIRIIATCTHPLDALVRAGRFRSDVYYRLAGLEIQLPLLSERLEDLPTLLELFFDALPDARRHPPRRLDESAMRALLLHDWPGNLRELSNRLRQAVLLSDRRTITTNDLGLTPHPPGQYEGLSLDQFRARAEQQAVSCSLALTHNNVSAAARLLDISRVSMYRLMEKHRTYRG
ncbi:sigma-54 dependent transcriptional regulator [Marinobacter xestospongiae]|uniref:sigma-54 dependent transcriptional regulator n=1 Tax=Marinobacter xestospongiae TaxID=994319 RepID=UPI002006B56E|nr:sigma 54-interacting transcriptional regulator [Marinobacter xestospongiae]MCK7566632.1 sigma 54-interacting transcriptional regulator [Marinobacter xestospongiae]